VNTTDEIANTAYINDYNLFPEVAVLSFCCN